MQLICEGNGGALHVGPTSSILPPPSSDGAIPASPRSEELILRAALGLGEGEAMMVLQHQPHVDQSSSAAGRGYGSLWLAWPWRGELAVDSS